MAVGIIGLDIAKHVFQVHGADGMGRAFLTNRRRRRQVFALTHALELSLSHLHNRGPTLSTPTKSQRRRTVVVPRGR
jgi:hypothetical protein